MDLDQELEGFADYANNNVRALFNSFNTDEDRRWAWSAIQSVQKYFPRLNHRAVDKNEIQMRSEPAAQRLKRIFTLHGLCLWLNGTSSSNTDQGFPRCFCPPLSEHEQKQSGGATVLWWIGKGVDEVGHKNENEIEQWVKYIHDNAEKVGNLNKFQGKGLMPSGKEVSHKNSNDQSNELALNTILYGPPGTGKTYKTIDKAIDIIDRDFYSTHKDKNENTRKALKERFDKLCEENKIVMTTFHQSYSYEDFVEGLSAESKEGQLVYGIKKGIFKTICERAAKSQLESNFDEVYTKFCNDIKEQNLTLRTLKRNNAIDIEVSNQQNLVVIPQTETKTRMTITKENLKQFILNDAVGDWPIYTRVIKKHLEDNYQLRTHPQRSNYVLIIDEINRGNVSNIFGELITLIEESKRAGKDEALSVTLPYSKETFSVPSNLYIVGTMNTADRSLTQIDTALRRRFHFEEMMPNPDLLEGLVIDNINICNLLKCLNERIEALYDREHTLGHAFFMELLEEDKKNIDTLAAIFKNKVIPLLQEYFFDDWGKIQLILGDTVIQKKEKFIQFAMPVPDNLVTPDAYKINYAALDKSETYTAIYVNCPSTVND